MRRLRLSGVLIAGFASWMAISAAAQTPTTIVRDVRTAVNCTDWPCPADGDFAAAEALLAEYRAAQGDTSQALEALSWLGRAALAANELDRASAYAAETYALAVEALENSSLEEDRSLEAALGAAIEVRSQAQAARGQRSDAVYFLRRELETYQDTPLHRRLQKNLLLLSLEGQPAPELEGGNYLGASVPSFEELRGKVVLLFFWAHWCGDCKAQGPILSKVLDSHRAEGLVVVAPTQRYGYTERRSVTAGPEEELRYIAQVRDMYYPFLADQPVPVSEANHTAYGVSTTPTLVIVDRAGIVRLYHPGNLTEEELEAEVQPLLASN